MAHMQACDTTILISYFADFVYLVEFKRIFNLKKGYFFARGSPKTF